MSKSNLVLFVILICFGCNQKQRVPPNDFGFILEYHFSDKANSIDSTFTRYYNSDQKVVTIIYSEDEKIEIYNQLEDMKFFDYPSEFSSSKCDSYTLPPFGYVLTVQAENRSKKVHWVDGCLGEYDSPAKKLNDVITLIIETTEKRQEVKQLEKTDFVII